MKLKEGQTVLLTKFEDQPEEKATILGIQKNRMLTVEVKPHNKYDDGLRECDQGQVKKILKEA